MLCFSFMLFSACIPAVIPDPFKAEDINPPSVLAWGMETDTSIAITFTEAVFTEGHSFSIQNSDSTHDSATDLIVCTPVSAPDTSEGGTRLYLESSKPCNPGEQYLLVGTVHDKYGNSLAFSLPCWGFNARIPTLLLSELLTEGTTTHPDIIELYVKKSGNLAGCAVFVGTPGTYTFRYIFPPCNVLAGEFILLHLKPQGLPDEIDETMDIAASGGLDSSALARDFWCKQETGSLSGKNGAVSVFSNPSGYCIDAVIYSERTSESDANYRGFGTASLLAMVKELFESGCWLMPDGIRPEAAAQSAGTTSTRTICRWSDERDTNRNTDWHIVPTKGSTLGTVNKDDIYNPSAKTLK